MPILDDQRFWVCGVTLIILLSVTSSGGKPGCWCGLARDSRPCAVGVRCNGSDGGLRRGDERMGKRIAVWCLPCYFGLSGLVTTKMHGHFAVQLTTGKGRTNAVFCLSSSILLLQQQYLGRAGRQASASIKQCRLMLTSPQAGCEHLQTSPRREYQIEE